MHRILAKAQERILDVYLYGVVGWDITAKGLIDELKGAEYDALQVHINSGGGDVIEGNAIYNVIKGFKGSKTAIIDGMAGSAASYIMLACDTIKAHENAYIFIHNPWVEWASGNSKDLDKISDELKKCEQTLVAAYIAKSGKTEEEVRAAMDAETLFTATEAKEFGLVDEVLESQEQAQASAKAYMRMVAKVDFKDFLARVKTAQKTNVKINKIKGEYMTKEDIIANLTALADTLDEEAKAALMAEIANIEESLETKPDEGNGGEGGEGSGEGEGGTEGGGAGEGGEGDANAQATEQINALIAELKQAKEEFGKMKADFAEANKQFLAKYAIGASKDEPKKRLSKYEQYEALLKDGKRDEARNLLRRK